MQRLGRIGFGLMLLFGLVFTTVQAQATCDGQTFDDAYDRAESAYWNGSYSLAIDYYSCAIALIPDDVLAEGEIGLRNPMAVSFLGRAWAYLQNGEFELTHSDFYEWIRLTELQTVEASLDDTLAGGNFEIHPNMAYRLSFEGQEGEIWGFSAMSFDSIDPLIVLLDPTGAVMLADDDGGINLNSVIRRYPLAETGTYTLVIGQAGAYGTGDIELAVYKDGEVRSSNPDNANAIVSFATYYLYTGETAEVFTTNGDHLNVRSGSGVSFPVLVQLNAGDHVTLLDGPHKVDDGDGYSWWHIRTADGVEGWAVERVETEQTLQMALFSGEEAVVMSAPDLLNVREAPTRSGAVAFQLEDGVTVTILEDEPVTADGYRWWHIRDAEGREGWAVDRIGIERTLAPMREFPN